MMVVSSSVNRVALVVAVLLAGGIGWIAIADRDPVLFVLGLGLLIVAPFVRRTDPVASTEAFRARVDQLQAMPAPPAAGGTATGETPIPGMSPQVLAQLVAGIWEFRTGNTFGAVAFCSFGAFWISFYFIVQAAGTVAKTELFSGLGLYLWMWGLFTAMMFLASLRTTGAIAVVFFLLTLTFIVLGIGNSALAGGTSVTNGTIKLGGYLGIITAIAAWYAAMAAVLASTFGRDVLPVFPLSR